MAWFAALRRAPKTLVATGVAVAAVATGAGVFALTRADAPTAVAGIDPAATTVTTTTQPATTTSSSTTTTTTTIPNPPPEPLALPPVPPGGLRYGMRSDVVAAYELRLKQLHFDPGEIDGYFDGAMVYAVHTAAKILGATPRGVIDDNLRFGLSVFQWPESMVADGERDRVEVSLDRQYMTVYQDNRIVLFTTVSTGSGKVFCGGHDGCQYATTPPGRFTLKYFVNGWRTGSLGRMYKPFYFNGGIAVHGYPTVPTEPASHGCVRIPMAIAEYWHTLVHKEEPIYVVGTAAAPYGRAPRPAPPPPPPTTAPPETTVPPPPPTEAPPTTIAPVTTAPPTTLKCVPGLLHPCPEG
jgi:hypothetical protein